MTPGARISAAIESLDEIFAGMPAEKSLTSWARRSRFAGSKDRAAVRDLVFDALRARDSFAKLGGGLSGRGVMIGHALAHDLPLAELFNGAGHAPKPLDEMESALIKTLSDDENRAWDMIDWCADLLRSSHADDGAQIAERLKSRAPVDLRVNLRRATRESALADLAAEGIVCEVVDLSQTCLRILENPRKLKLSQAYLDGKVELQDAGSQALVDVLPINPGQCILDYCAGGGGKSLAMAAVSGAQIDAHDINVARMKDIPERAARAGASVQCLSSAEVEKQAPYDLVLCDAPCSGSGAWRRNPDAKWRLTIERFEELRKIQADILNKAKHLVKPNGFLAYATCSLFAQENEDQVNAFLKSSDNFTCIEQKSWTPLHGCDGFFVSILQLKDDVNQP